MRRVAVVGSGISGLAAAHALAGLTPTSRCSRRATTSAATPTRWTSRCPARAARHPRRGHRLPGLQRAHLPEPDAPVRRAAACETATSDMSFSVQVPGTGNGRRWSGAARDLNTVFAQRRNLLRPALLAHAGRHRALQPPHHRAGRARRRSRTAPQPIGDFLDRARLRREFRDWYFLPMIGCIWSCPTDQMLRFPGRHDDPLLPQPRPDPGRQPAAVVHGARRRAALRRQDAAGIPDARLNTPVRSVRRLPPGSGRGGVLVATDAGSERFDDVVLACHSDQSAGAAGTTPRPTSARCSAPSATTPTAPCCTPTPRCCRGASCAWAAWNYERARRRRARAGGRLPALPDQPPAAAAVAAAGGGVAEPRPARPSTRRR